MNANPAPHFKVHTVHGVRWDFKVQPARMISDTHATVEIVTERAHEWCRAEGVNRLPARFETHEEAQAWVDQAVAALEAA